MKKYNHLLFDLDGTLTDPSEGITKCIAYALQHFGIETSDLTALQSWIDPPIKQSLMDIHHFDEAKADLGVEKYRERFAEIGLYENRLFDGIPELLESLKKQDYRLYLATSKPTMFAERILDHFEISSYFDFVPIDFSESFFIQYLRRYIFPSSHEYFYYSLSELKNKF